MSLNPIWDITFTLFISIATIWYFRSEKSGQISKLRQVLFYTAMFLLTIILVGPIPRKATELFWVHMVQHILIMMLISPLIILGSPFKLILSQNNSIAKITLFHIQ